MKKIITILLFTLLIKAGSAQIVQCDTMSINYISSQITFTDAQLSAADSSINIPLINNTQTNFAYPQAKLINTTSLPSGMSLYSNNWQVFASSWNVGDTATVHLAYNVNQVIPLNYSVTFQLYVTNFLPLSIDSCVFANTLTINLTSGASNTNTIMERKQLFNFSPNPALSSIEINSTSGKMQGIQLTDSKGSVLKEITIQKNKTTMDISDLKEGIYFLKNTSDGSVKKLIVIH